MTLRIYNTLTRKKEEFIPLNPDLVTMYVCGPNLYGPCHAGHAFSYIVFDTVRRYLKFKGYKLKHVQNFTDIEDRIIARSNEDNVPFQDIAGLHITRFYEEMDALNIERADAYPRATEVIPQIIGIIFDLIAKGYAYNINGDIYFSARKSEDYGKLSNRSIDEMRAGARIEINEQKEDPTDFALWKASRPGEPSWDSPWGKGRPGWHIECSAMNYREFGEQADIHGGGQDVIFPHHENEIAQSEAFTGKKPFVKYWMHNALLRLGKSNEEKMTRHLGNALWIRDILDRHDPDAIRLYFLSKHYRSSFAWEDNEIDAVSRGLNRIREAVKEINTDDIPENNNILAEFTDRIYKQFINAMDDDFNTPRAIAALYDLARELNRIRNNRPDGNTAYAQIMLRKLSGVLGLTLKEKAQDITDAGQFIDLLIRIRKELRDNKHYAIADNIRDELTNLGVVLEDRQEKTTWKR